MTSKTYYAHSAENLPYEHWQTMESHACNVGGMAAGFAAYFGAQEIARATGLLHDVGKYSPLFDKRLHGDPKRVDHSTAGAKIAVERWGVRLGKMMAFCIAGHHAGLANGAGAGDGRSTLQQRLDWQFGADIPKLDEVWRQEIDLPETLPAPSVKPDAGDYPHFTCAFFIRMLYSCLVDADFLDTEAFYAKLEQRETVRGGHPDLETLRPVFFDFINAFRRCATQAPSSSAMPH